MNDGEISDERHAAALREMLALLDQIEAIMNEAAYSEWGEQQIRALRSQWTYDLATVESALATRWTLMDMPRAH